MRSAVSAELEQAQKHAEAARAGLADSPQADFTAEILALEAAVGRLQLVKSKIETAPPLSLGERSAIRIDLENLQRELDRLARLVSHSEEFWRGWARMLGLDTGYATAYTPAGLPASANRALHLVTKG